MQIYNLFQVVFNSWLFYKVGLLWKDHYDWNCEPVDYSYRSIHFFKMLSMAMQIAINAKLHNDISRIRFHAKYSSRSAILTARLNTANIKILSWINFSHLKFTIYWVGERCVSCWGVRQSELTEIRPEFTNWVTWCMRSVEQWSRSQDSDDDSSSSPLLWMWE